ncbi:MAG: hypothetical protein NXH70_02100 [Hyphomonas sp.]|nr:hypothetical protein [Hyphomonas sp.]
MSTRTNVQTATTELIDQPMIWNMVNATPQAVGSMRKRIADLIEDRKARDEAKLPEGGQLSKDFRHLEDWKDCDAIARLFIAAEIDPKAYILNPYIEDAELIKRGFDPSARTRNLKAYKKVREVAEYVVTGNAKLEAVFKTFVACSIVASRTVEFIDSNVCERFLSSIPLNDVSEDLAQAVDAFQAKHMTTGAATQSSQMRLTLANLGAVQIQKEEGRKGFILNKESGLIQALAERFGMQDQLQAVA